jgi:hypothetical protein
MSFFGTIDFIAKVLFTENKPPEPVSVSVPVIFPVNISKEELNKLLPNWFLDAYQLCDDDYNKLRLNSKLQPKNGDDLKNGDFSKLNKHKWIPNNITEYILLNCNNEQIRFFMDNFREKIIFYNIRVPNDFIIDLLLIYIKHLYNENNRVASKKDYFLIFSNPHDKIVDFILQQYGDNITELVHFIFSSQCLYNTNNRIVDIIEDVLIKNGRCEYDELFHSIFFNKNPRMGGIFKKWLNVPWAHQRKYWENLYLSTMSVGANSSLVDYIEEELQNPNVFGLQLSMDNDSVTIHSVGFSNIHVIRYLFEGLMSNPNEKALLLFEKYKVAIEKHNLFGPYPKGNIRDVIKSNLLKNPILIDNSYYQNNDFILK